MAHIADYDHCDRRERLGEGSISLLVHNDNEDSTKSKKSDKALLLLDDGWMEKSELLILLIEGGYGDDDDDVEVRRFRFISMDALTSLFSFSFFNCFQGR